MCAFFPLLRMYAARRALSKEGKTDEKHQADVESKFGTNCLFDFYKICDFFEVTEY